MELDVFTLGIATKEYARHDHGLNPGKNNGSELVLWTDDTDGAVEFLLKIGAKGLSVPHDFLDEIRFKSFQRPKEFENACRKSLRFQFPRTRTKFLMIPCPMGASCHIYRLLDFSLPPESSDS